MTNTMERKINGYTVDEARKEYAKLSDTIFNILSNNGWNEEDLAVVALKAAGKALEEKFGFGTCDDDE